MLNLIRFLKNCSGFSRVNYHDSYSKLNFFCHKKFNMMYDQTFQHRARSSFFLKSFRPLTNERCTPTPRRRPEVPISQLIRKKISLSRKGKKLKVETKAKISNSLKGRSFSDAHINNLKIALSGIKNPMFGRLHSRFVKRKISNSLAKKKS